MVRLFELQEKCLHIMGYKMQIVRRKQNNKEKVFSLLKLVAPLLFVFTADYPMISYAIYNRDDIELTTACLSVAFTNLLTVIKISTFLVYQQSFWQMIHCFRQMYLKSQQSMANGHGNIVQANKLAASLTRAYFLSCGATGIYFMLGPIVKIIASKLWNVPYQRELPMKMKFPFNDEESPGYECAFIYTVFVTGFVVIHASAVDGLFISFAINLRAHFQALQLKFLDIQFELHEQQVQCQINAAIDYHINLLNLAKQLRVIYMPIVFAQFLTTSVLVGIIGYQIVTHINSIMALLVYFSFLGSIMLQLFIYCYGGNLIKTESQQVGVALQLCNWHLAKPKQRRCLVFIMHRSQRETLIKAAFYEASLANFLAICRAAMSFVTIIQSMD